MLSGRLSNKVTTDGRAAFFVNQRLTALVAAVYRLANGRKSRIYKQLTRVVTKFS
jgi:hypothetical protein